MRCAARGGMLPRRRSPQNDSGRRKIRICSILRFAVQAGMTAMNGSLPERAYFGNAVEPDDASHRSAFFNPAIAMRP